MLEIFFVIGFFLMLLLTGISVLGVLGVLVVLVVGSLVMLFAGLYRHCGQNSAVAAAGVSGGLDLACGEETGVAALAI